MGADLTEFERGESYAGDYDADLAALQDRLAKIQASYISYGNSAMIAVEGWDASGKGGAISRLTAGWDPRWFEVWPIGAPTEEERTRHFLWRFWKRLPGKGEINIFDRTWYGRVLVERIEGFCTDAQWQRAYDEINEFEAQQRDNGVVLIKIFMHVTQEEQDKRFRKRLANPWKRWKTGKDDYRNRARRADYVNAYQDMFKRCDTRWAPWTIIDANNKKSARMAFLNAVADQLEKHANMTPPPLDPEVEELARQAYGEVDASA